MYFKMKKGKLLIFSAPSGAGKTTIVRHLLETRTDLEFSVSATSRPPRKGETHGKDYYFMTEEEFRKKMNDNEFLEWEEVYPGTFYGTLKSEVNRIIGEGKNVIFDVDVIGGLNIKEFYGDEALSIFVQPPAAIATTTLNGVTTTTTTTPVETLEDRLRSRSTESEEKIRTRLEKAARELSFASRFDVILVNDDLELAFLEARKIVSDFIDNTDG